MIKILQIKKWKKKMQLLFGLMLFFSINASAYDFEVDGIYYNFLENNSVEVTTGGNRSIPTASYKGDMTISQTVFYEDTEYNVIAIGEDAFYRCSSLTSIYLPDGITSIGNYAFNSCSSLTSITLPGSISNIGTSVFQYCSSLVSIIIPEGVTKIDESTFWTCI